MELREKVISGLECCAVGCRSGCPYSDIDDCESLLCADALALLKAQEPVKAYRLHNEKVIDRSEKVFVAQCTNCSGYLVDGWKACPICGKAVKWE